ncbi:unnamed protein product [Rotaria sordida]|uniref:MATH domain-containing protein n=1 Tax=Rotaria sordida TaxID=392033 RepID=A0A814KDS5_9BILA|nr:unnamed protein product [Rotaria sordida]CAF3754171.1 unnamed protein product [Rotaria sordida]
MEVHYLTQEHQVAIINCIRHLSNVHPDKHFENHLEMALSKLQVYETINVLTDGIHTLNNNVERLRNAQSGRQTSIYSPPFYSSPTGYKMCARLHLNGNGDGQGTHMSLFFILMKGKYDDILGWPFNSRIIFSLYDQTDKKQHIFDTFQPDVISNRCQRPHTDTNIASGIPKFIPLAIIEQENNPYVQEDSIFIKIMVDFNQIPDNLLPYVLSLDPGLPTLQQHKLIQEAINNFYQNQSITNITNTQNISQIILSS